MLNRRWTCRWQEACVSRCAHPRYPGCCFCLAAKPRLALVTAVTCSSRRARPAAAPPLPHSSRHRPTQHRPSSPLQAVPPPLMISGLRAAQLASVSAAAAVGGTGAALSRLASVISDMQLPGTLRSAGLSSGGRGATLAPQPAAAAAGRAAGRPQAFGAPVVAFSSASEAQQQQQHMQQPAAPAPPQQPRSMLHVRGIGKSYQRLLMQHGIQTVEQLSDLVLQQLAGSSSSGGGTPPPPDDALSGSAAVKYLQVSAARVLYTAPRLRCDSQRCDAQAQRAALPLSTAPRLPRRRSALRPRAWASGVPTTRRASWRTSHPCTRPSCTAGWRARAALPAAGPASRSASRATSAPASPRSCDTSPTTTRR